MAVFLETSTAAFEIRKCLIPPGARITIGRTEQSDYAFPHDLFMSSRHFELDLVFSPMVVRDLGSSNGTFVNDRRIEKKTTVYEGDEIRAGETTFVVMVEHGPILPDPNFKTAPLPIGGVAIAPPRKLKGSFRAFPCNSKLTAHLGQQCTFAPGEIAAALAELAPLYLVTAAGEAAAATLGVPSTPLSDQLVADSELTGPPALIGPTAGEALGELLAAAWAQNKAFCILDRRPPAVLSQQLIDFVRSQQQLKAADVAALRPAAVSEFLSMTGPDQVGSLFGGSEAIFTEVHQGDRWGIFAPRSFGATLAKLGLKRLGAPAAAI